MAVLAGAVGLVPAVLLVVGLFSRSGWWPIASGVFAVACFVSAAAQFRMQTRKASGRR